MPDAPGLELIRQDCNAAHPDAVLDTSFDHDQAALLADPKQILDVLGWLRDTPGQEYRFLSSLHVADYLPAQPRFGVHYELLNMPRVERIRVKAMLAGPGAASNGDAAGAGNPAAPGSGAEEAGGFDVVCLSGRGDKDLAEALAGLDRLDG